MTSKNAICTKLGTQCKIVPGQLLKIIEENLEDYVIQLYDHDNNRFENKLYKCEKENIKEMDDNIWSFVSELRKGDNITVNLEVFNTKINVNFCVKSIMDVPSLEPGQYFALNLIDNPNLNEENKLLIKVRYYVQDVSAFCIRGDKLLEGLIIHQATRSQTLNISTQNSYTSEKSDFDDVIDSINKTVLEPTISINQSVTGTPPSNQFFRQDNVKDFRTSSNVTLNKGAILRNHDHDGQVPFEKYQNIAAKPSIVAENSPPSPKNVTIAKKSKPDKFQQNYNKRTTKCYLCDELIENAFKLDCQHLCCPQCLLSSISLEDPYCPFATESFECNFKLENDVMASLFEALDRSLFESGTNNTEIMPNSKRFIVEANSSFEKVELFEYDDKDSNETLFYCKKEKCEGLWFVDKTEGRNIYPCPLCESYNCFKCLVIHDDMTCEEYNQQNRR